MSEFRLRRVRSSADVSSRPLFDLGSLGTVSRSDSVRDISSVGRGGYYSAYVYRKPYIYNRICPPYNYYRRDYPSDGTLRDPFPTYLRNASSYRNPHPCYPSTYPYYTKYSHSYSPISYSRIWSEHYYRPYY